MFFPFLGCTESTVVECGWVRKRWFSSGKELPSLLLAGTLAVGRRRFYPGPYLLPQEHSLLLSTPAHF